MRWRTEPTYNGAYAFTGTVTEVVFDVQPAHHAAQVNREEIP